MTLDQIMAFASSAEDVAAALADIAAGHATSADVETIADDVIVEALSLTPGAAVFAQFAPAVVALVVEAAMSGAIKPSQNPISEGQTTPPATTHGQWVGR